MNTTAVRIVLDTNILVAIIGRKSPFRWIFDCILQGKLILCVSTEIVLEYREILEKKNGQEVAESIINFLAISPYVEKIESFFDFQLITQDQDDNKFVNCAITSSALCIVSNDKHFQVLKDVEFPQVTILTIQEFENEYKTHFLSL
jgi:putative PIN family toxin of toxin-antitoxin system